jgi:coenzyme F420-dependent glucose-6-phosphate dehydrogenase
MEFGYWLSSEEHRPRELVSNASRAESLGFSFALISDHFHPWTRRQGNSAFVWGVLGAIGQATARLRVGTGVTCPILRMHPVLVAHAAATAAVMMPGRFFLGLGTGENLNEHVLGQPWPSPGVRLEMLEEATDILRKLWRGRSLTLHGRYFRVQDAELFTLPEEPPPILIAAGGTRSVKLAGRIGDGLIAVAPGRKTIQAFEDEGGAGKPKIAQLSVCWAASDQAARRIALQWWPNGAWSGRLSTNLRSVDEFEDVAQLVREDDVAKKMVLGPDPHPYLEAVRDLEHAGFDHIAFHQVGPDQEGFFQFWQSELLPKLGAGANVLR